MRIFRNTSFIWLAAAFSGLIAASGESAAADPDVLRVVGPQPFGSVLDVAEPKRFDFRYVFAPSVLFDGTTYRMWYGAKDVPLPGEAGIGLATSPVGMNWTGAEDNQYVMLFSGNPPDSSWAIYGATSLDGRVWQMPGKGQPMLAPGTGDRFDNVQAWHPTILRQGNELKAWYSGQRTDRGIGTIRTGLATAVVDKPIVTPAVELPVSQFSGETPIVVVASTDPADAKVSVDSNSSVKEAEVWDMEFAGKGDPGDTGFKGHLVNGSTFNLYDKFTNLDVLPGWMTANGNPGGYFYKQPETRNTMLAGWTAEWLLAVENRGRGVALNFNDDTSLINVIYDEPANTVTLADNLIGLEGNDESVSVPVDLDERVGHTCRLVRQPQSPTVELYIDNHPVAVAVITPWRAADHGEAAQLNRVIFAHSDLNAAWDFFRYHRGATIPRSAPKTESADSPVKSRDGYRTYVVAPAINNSTILEGQPLPTVCTREKVMKVLCARGEYEPASFVIQTDQPMEKVMVRVTDLTGPAGVLPAEAVDVRIVQKVYRASTWKHVTMPWVLVHDPQMMTIVDKHPKWVNELMEESWKSPNGHSLQEYKAGKSRMNRLNKELIDTDTLQPSDIENFQQFWLTVHVPRDAQPGTYRGEVTITAAGAARTMLPLEVTVPSFDLLPPNFEYSVYYPTLLERPDTTSAEREKYHPVTEQQYLAESRNMVRHGCMNPCIYAGPQQDEAGNIHFTWLSRLLDLREQAGMPKGVMLYLMDGAGMTILTGELTDQQKQRNIEVAQATVAWALTRGYSGALFMGADEYSGASLRAMRESYQSVRDGGSGIWVAGGGDLVDFMSDVVDVPVFAHPGAMAVDRHVQWGVDAVEWLLHPERTPNWDPEILLTPGYQKMIETAHQNGNRILTYFDPQGGQPFPQYHRRHRGLGLWKTGLDGTMTWAYIHIWSRTLQPNDPVIMDNGVDIGGNSFVLRGPQGPLDTLSWEGYREGYDDARYLATLQEAMARAMAAGKHAEVVVQTQRWMDGITVDADLDGWRREMARRTETLLGN